MHIRLLISVTPGFIASLLANLITSSWNTLNLEIRLGISILIGVLIAFLIFFSVKDNEKVFGIRVASRIESDSNINVEVIDVALKNSSVIDTEIASDLSAKGNVEIKDIKFRDEQ